MVVLNSGAYPLKAADSGGFVTGLDKPGYITALDVFRNAVKEGVVPPGFTSTGYPEASAQLATGKAVMMTTGPHSMGIIVTANPDLKGKLAAFPLPTANGQKPITTLGQHGYAISRNSKNTAVAVQYIKFMLSTKNILVYNDLEYRLPSRLKAQKDPQVASGMAAGFVNALKGEIWSDSTASYLGSITNQQIIDFSDALQGVKSSKDIQDASVKAVKKLIADNA